MMGNLFYRGVSPGEIKKMEFWELKYWNEWHNRIVKAEETAAKKMNKGNDGK